MGNVSLLMKAAARNKEFWRLKTRLKAASNGKQLKMEWVKELSSIRRWKVLLHFQLLGSAVLAD